MICYEEIARLWEENRYEEVLDIWKEYLEQDVMREEISTNLEEAFLQPNENEFVQALQKNYRLLLNKNLPDTEALCIYSNSPIRYVCYDEGKYYLYDRRERKLYGKIDLLPKEKEMQFDDILLLNPLNVGDIAACLAGGYKRKLYCMGRKMEGWSSIFFLPELGNVLEEEPVWFLNCQEEMEYFLKNKSAYIPKKIVGNADEIQVNQVMDTFTELHNKRLKKEYRADDNILLTIGIPTYNRGNRALQNVMNCLNSVYDAEIEVLVSDNASIKHTEEYEEIRNIKDARLSYDRLPENRQFLGNLENLFAKSKGKYLLLISDEDFVIIKNLNYYLALIRNNEEVGMIRGSVTGHDNTAEYKDEIAEKNSQAFLTIFLHNNYMSGAIYLRDGFTSHILENISVKYRENEAFLYYPHMFLDAVISERYNIITDSKNLIYTGEAEANETAPQGELIAYAKLESRLKQHRGWREFLDDMDELPLDVKIQGYRAVCWKTFFLVYLVRSYYQKNWEETLRKVAECCAEEFDKIKILSEQSKMMLQEEVLDSIMDNYVKYLKMV